MFKLTHVHQLSKPEAKCENCGHDIAQLFFLKEIETGRGMMVGIECAAHLLSGDAAFDADVFKRRLVRAAGQYRKLRPTVRAGESREAYINRRVAEMTNAFAAHKAWRAEYAALFQSRRNTFSWSITYAMKVEERGKRLGVRIDRDAVIQRHRERIARRFNANPFDFERPTWNVKYL